jgi:hypothetical protein
MKIILNLQTIFFVPREHSSPIWLLFNEQFFELYGHLLKPHEYFLKPFEHFQLYNFFIQRCELVSICKLLQLYSHFPKLEAIPILLYARILSLKRANHHLATASHHTTLAAPESSCRTQKQYQEHKNTYKKFYTNYTKMRLDAPTKFPHKLTHLSTLISTKIYYHHLRLEFYPWSMQTNALQLSRVTPLQSHRSQPVLNSNQVHRK